MSLAVFALVASPLLAFLGVLAGHRVARSSARELDRWRRREETMRLLRWATELAVDRDPARSLVGVEVLGALVDAPILDADDRKLVAAVFAAAADHAILETKEGHPP
jgi:hypothetical protein